VGVAAEHVNQSVVREPREPGRAVAAFGQRSGRRLDERSRRDGVAKQCLEVIADEALRSSASKSSPTWRSG
jgi:hypothetical protein